MAIAQVLDPTLDELPPKEWPDLRAEVLARYCNLSHQQKQIAELLAIGPAGRDDADDSNRTSRNPPQLRSPEVAALVKGYQARASMYELGDMFSISRQTVSEHLHRQCGDNAATGLEQDRDRPIRDAVGAGLVARQDRRQIRRGRHDSVGTVAGA